MCWGLWYQYFSYNSITSISGSLWVYSVVWRRWLNILGDDQIFLNFDINTRVESIFWWGNDLRNDICTTTLWQLFDNILSHTHIILLFSLFLFLFPLFFTNEKRERERERERESSQELSQMDVQISLLNDFTNKCLTSKPKAETTAIELGVFSIQTLS